MSKFTSPCKASSRPDNECEDASGMNTSSSNNGVDINLTKSMSIPPAEIPVNSTKDTSDQQKHVTNEIMVQKRDSPLSVSADAKDCQLSSQTTSTSSGTVCSTSSSAVTDRTQSSVSSQPSYVDLSKFSAWQSPNCCILNLGSNIFVPICVRTPSEYSHLIPKNDEANENDFYRKKPIKKRRHRKNFDQNVKKRILDIYLKMINEDPSYSIRNVALAIYKTMSKEAGFDHTYKNILTLLYNYRQKQ